MTNWERYFGSPEAAMRMGVRMMTWPNDKVGRMSRPGCNRGCLLIIAASLLIDGLTLWAAVSLARMIIGG